MSLMKRALDAARRKLKRYSGKIGAATTMSALAALSGGTQSNGPRRYLPIWVGGKRDALGGKLPSPYVSKAQRPEDWKPVYVRFIASPLGTYETSKQQRRARDRQMRQGLPSMSGRQWRRIRKAMYRKAKFLTIQQRQEAGR